MAAVPVASAALGAVAGLPAARLVASHFAVMTRDTSQVMIAGPALVERALGERADKEALGGAAVHEKSGVVDAVARDERDAFAQIRRFLSYLPTNVWQAAPRAECDDPRDRAEAALLAIVPRDRRKIYDARELVRLVLDRDSLFELGRGYGRAQITALARLGGQPVGVWANDPRFYAGAMTAAAARKVRRFVELCDTFHLPIVAFVDEPGFMIGSPAEREATIRFGAEAIFAVVQATVPWASVIVRKSYGVAAAAHFAPDAAVFAWPSAEGGALPIEGGVAVAFRREIASAPDPDARRRELEAQFAGARSPFARAEAFGVHDLLDPRETRARLCDWVEEIQPALAGQRRAAALCAAALTAGSCPPTPLCTGPRRAAPRAGRSRARRTRRTGDRARPRDRAARSRSSARARSSRTRAAPRWARSGRRARGADRTDRRASGSRAASRAWASSS